jgi:hypothetical protein
MYEQNKLLKKVEVWKQTFVTSNLNTLWRHHVFKDNLNDEIGNANKIFQKYINSKQFLAVTIATNHAHKTQ